MSDADLRIDSLTGGSVMVTPWRQQRPNLPEGPCPFCPGGLEAPEPYDVRHIPNRWPARGHIADLLAAGPELRQGLAVILVDVLARLERLLGPDAPYMLWAHQRPNNGGDWPAAHLHLHLITSHTSLKLDSSGAGREWAG